MMSEHDKISKSCPYCLSTGRLYVYHGGSNYYRCDGCDLIFRDGRQHENGDDLHRYYEDHYFDDCAEDEMTGQRNSIYRRVMDAIGKEAPPGKLLDVGCGCGFLLNEARRRGWRIMGIDPSVKSMDHAENMLESRLFRGTLETFPLGDTFDVVTFINVLDHSAAPWKDIQHAVRLLNRGGLLFLRFPNGLFHPVIQQISSGFMGNAVMHKYLVLHEYSFTPFFIKHLLSDHGFTGIEIRNASLSGGSVFSRILKKTFAIAAHSLYLASAGKMIFGPSLEVMARK